MEKQGEEVSEVLQEVQEKVERENYYGDKSSLAKGGYERCENFRGVKEEGGGEEKRDSGGGKM